MERRGIWVTSSRLAAWRTRSTSRLRSSSPKGETRRAEAPVIITVLVWNTSLFNFNCKWKQPSSACQVSEVPDKEVPEEEQPAWLAQGGGLRQGDVRAALLPNQSGWRGVGGRRVNGLSRVPQLERERTIKVEKWLLLFCDFVLTPERCIIRRHKSNILSLHCYVLLWLFSLSNVHTKVSLDKCTGFVNWNLRLHLFISEPLTNMTSLFTSSFNKVWTTEQ